LRFVSFLLGSGFTFRMSVTPSAKLSGYNASGCLIEGNLTRFVAVRAFRFPRREHSTRFAASAVARAGTQQIGCVEAYEPDRRLRLVAEMKVPGRAWLELTVEPDGTSSIIRQTAEFEPRGLLGLLYWYALYPIHKLMFCGMLRKIATASLSK
jgi:hypothetical protein